MPAVPSYTDAKPAPPHHHGRTTVTAGQIGQWVHEQLGVNLPGMLVQTAGSLLSGVNDTQCWQAALSAAHGPHTAWRTALCDHGDLTALPAAIAHWGRPHTAVAANVAIHAPGCDERQAQWVGLLVPDAAAYRALCRWLSWRHEEPRAWQAWQRGESLQAPDPASLIALCADEQVLSFLSNQNFDARPYACLQAWHGDRNSDAVAVPFLSTIGIGDHHATTLLHRLHETSTTAFRTAERYARLPALALAELPQWWSAFDNQVGQDQLQRGKELLQNCTFLPGEPLAHGHPRLHMPQVDASDPDAALRVVAQQGMTRRYGNNPLPAALQRLDHELAIIARKGFSRYILVVRDLTQGRRTCGRGSGASSLVCYVLGITNVDPIRYQLVFERFLCDERHDPPDIDIDFPWDERDLVHLAAMQRYGRDHVAMIATHQSMSPRGAFREMARIHGQQRSDITAVAQQRDHHHRYGAGGALDGAWRTIAEEAQHITGLTRSWGLHCGGVVITDEPIRDIVPIHPAAKQIGGQPVPTIAWEKDGAEAMGLVKIDLLGNRSLAVIRDTLIDLAADGTHLDEQRWHPEDDPLTQRLIARGRTIGCFYIESPAMRLLNSKAGTVDFDRLVIHSSIIRPAANQWIQTYLERLHHVRRTGQHDEAWYPHPALRSLLSDSFGILSYQEDVMLIARELANFNTSLQNKLRKALGRSDTLQRLSELSEQFTQGCRANQVSQPVQDLVWTMITSFAGYSFCKAHSASYAMVSFQCAYLKIHHPAYFMARVIANGGGFYTISVYVEEARRHGVAIRPPCVLHGHYDTRCEGAGAIRLGMQLIRGLRRSAIERIIQERRRWPFRTLRDFIERTRLHRSDLRALHAAGACDTLLDVYTPGQREWLIRRALTQPGWPTAEEGQAQLDFAHLDPEPPCNVREPSQQQQDQRCWNVLGCLPRCHPLALWNIPPRDHRRSCCREVDPRYQRYTLTIIAWAITRKDITAKQPSSAHPASERAPMAFVTLEDETGIAETVWFPDTYRRCGIALESGQPLHVRGRVEVEFGVATLHVHSAQVWQSPTHAYR